MVSGNRHRRRTGVNACDPDGIRRTFWCPRGGYRFTCQGHPRPCWRTFGRVASTPHWRLLRHLDPEFFRNDTSVELPGAGDRSGCWTHRCLPGQCLRRGRDSAAGPIFGHISPQGNVDPASLGSRRSLSNWRGWPKDARSGWTISDDGWWKSTVEGHAVIPTARLVKFDPHLTFSTLTWIGIWKVRARHPKGWPVVLSWPKVAIDERPLEAVYRSYCLRREGTLCRAFAGIDKARRLGIPNNRRGSRPTTP